MASKDWLAYCKMIRNGKETRSRMRRNKLRNNAKTYEHTNTAKK